MSPTGVSTTHLELRLLGPPELLADGAPADIERRKALALLAYLALEPGDHPRDALATLLAPEDDQQRARAGLRRALAALAPVARTWLHATADTIALRPSPEFTLDVAAFRASLRAGGEGLRAAADIYRGDFMAGFSLPGSAAFEEWQFLQSERLRGELADALDRLTRPEEARRDPERAADDARRWLTLDPLHEPAHRRLMQIYAAAGQSAAALRQYRVLAETLERELGAEPEPETAALAEQIRLGDRAAQASRWSAAPPRLTAAEAAGTAIETSSLPLLGRDLELATIAAALADPACRLLTLIGPGGMGKTRLAVSAAALHQPAFPDGVIQVSLTGISAADRLLTAIGAALGVAATGAPLDQIGAALRDRRALLLLDNFDHVLDGAPLLRGIIQRTSALKLLVTSRERLQLQDEWVLDVGGLPAPESADAPDAASFSAVQLFAQRAQQVRADFALGEANLPDVVTICQLVEGMPLAIVLAAAWVRVLEPAEIARELADSMALLTTTLRDLPERHRSVEGVFAQAWERLTTPERQALARLSVFEDGFTRAAAAEVAGATPVLLAGLADKSLVRRDQAGRYAIHELLRQFAARKLGEDATDYGATMRRLCAFAARLLDERNADMQGASQRQALAELSAEYDNLWSAWIWGVAARRLADLARGLDGLYRVHELRGWYTDGIHALTALADELAGDAPAGEDVASRDLLLARARARLGALYCWVGQFDAAERQLTAAMPVLRERAEEQDSAFALVSLGIVASERDENQPARELLEEGLAIYRRLDHQPGIAWAIDALGDLAASTGEYGLAQQLLSESSTRFSQLGDQVSAAWSLCSLGRVLGLMGEGASARQLLDESLAMFGALGDQHGAATASANLAEIAARERDLSSARARWTAALRLAREVGAMPLVLDAIVGAAQILSESGEPERAAELAALVAEHPASWKETAAAARAVGSAAARSEENRAAGLRHGSLTVDAAAQWLLERWG